MKIFRPQARFIPGMLLITGTCVGAGMLGLPGITGPSGALPAFTVTTACFLVMLLTGLLFLEATLWLPEHANLISITGKILGRWGKWISVLFFIFLYYCLMVAYISGGSPLLPIAYSGIIFPLIFALLIFFGPKLVGRVNVLLMVGFAISYFLLLGTTLPFLERAHFMHARWPLMAMGAPILFSAFGFHNIIPTLASYMHRDRKQLIRTVVCGTFLSYVIYVLWQWAVIGSLPEDYLIEAQKSGVPITQILEEFAENTWLAVLSGCFAFFALVTSLLGVSLSMVDFLADGLQLRRVGWMRAVLVGCVYIPPAVCAYIYPDIFLDSLGVAGGIGEALLNALIPISLVYVGRKKLHLEPLLSWIGHPALLIFLALFTLTVMGIEIEHLTH